MFDQRPSFKNINLLSIVTCNIDSGSQSETSYYDSRCHYSRWTDLFYFVGEMSNVIILGVIGFWQLTVYFFLDQDQKYVQFACEESKWGCESSFTGNRKIKHDFYTTLWWPLPLCTLLSAGERRSDPNKKKLDKLVKEGQLCPGLLTGVCREKINPSDLWVHLQLLHLLQLPSATASDFSTHSCLSLQPYLLCEVQFNSILAPGGCKTYKKTFKLQILRKTMDHHWSQQTYSNIMTYLLEGYDLLQWYSQIYT